MKRCTACVGVQVREQGTDRAQAPVVCPKSHKHHGMVSVSMTFTKNQGGGGGQVGRQAGAGRGSAASHPPMKS